VYARVFGSYGTTNSFRIAFLPLSNVAIPCQTAAGEACPSQKPPSRAIATSRCTFSISKFQQFFIVVQIFIHNDNTKSRRGVVSCIGGGIGRGE